MSSRPVHVIEKWLESYNLSQYIDGVTNQKIPATVYKVEPAETIIQDVI